jgi:hypothetical protein
LSFAGVKVVHFLVWDSQDAKLVKSLAARCREALTMKLEAGEKSEEIPGRAVRLAAAHLLSRLLNHPSVVKPEEEDFRSAQLQLLFALSFFKPTSKNSHEFETILGYKHNWAFNMVSCFRLKLNARNSCEFFFHLLTSFVKPDHVIGFKRSSS